MSSILDALKKVEEEKQAAQQQGIDINDAIAERDLIGRASRGPGLGSNTAMMLFGAAFAVVTITVSVAVILTLIKAQTTPPVVAVNPPAQVQPAPVAPAPVVTAPVQTAPVAATPEPVATEPAPVAEVAKVMPPTPPPRPERNFEVIAPQASAEPEEIIKKETPPAPVKPRVEKLPPPSAVGFVDEPKQIAMDDAAEALRPRTLTAEEVRVLPMASSDIKSRYGMDSMTINMLSEANERKPHAFAVINLSRVNIGDEIPKTEAKLIGICSDGIGIEIAESGARYFIPN